MKNCLFAFALFWSAVGTAHYSIVLRCLNAGDVFVVTVYDQAGRLEAHLEWQDLATESYQEKTYPVTDQSAGNSLLITDIPDGKNFRLESAGLHGAYYQTHLVAVADGVEMSGIVECHREPQPR